MSKQEHESLRENDIRPDQLMGQAMQLLEEDTKRLIKKKAEFVRIQCPACDGKDTRKIFEKRGMDFEICNDCGTVFGNPRPTPALLEQYYKEAKYYEYWNRYIYPHSEEARRTKIFRPRVKRIIEICKQFGIPNRTIVEVGAGFGIFCEEIQNTGVFEKIMAIEPTPKLAESCRKRGVEVIEKPVEQVHLDQERIDVVASFEVIEHLFSPRDLLMSCARILSPGGLLVISCPNIRGFDLLILNEVADTITPEHLNYFHPESIKTLVAACGFEPLEVNTPGKLDAEIVRKKVLAGKFNLNGMPFLHYILLDEWDRFGATFQAFLSANGLSSHMWLTARKK
ncbi:MAG: class I SAM-dependent methyltransferase [Desulfobacteraceae bacterium]|jgi:2-polyprenyl-3-methyl-5-hydroxy-6-metoxy-1,4-benzoquinol methylase